MKHKFSYKANSKEFSLVSGLIPSPSRETFASMLHLSPKLPHKSHNKYISWYRVSNYY